MRDAILELRDVEYAYEGDALALRGVSLSIGAAERIVLLGNNGAGKSTLFLSCNGVLHPKKGERLLHGRPIGEKKRDLMELRQKVGVVFQEPDRQFVAPTVEEEVSFGPMNLGLPEEEVRARVDEVLAMMRLGEYRQRPPHMLSGGEKKLVSIAGVLVMQPEIILLDEPTATLDPRNIILLEENLELLWEAGITLLVATHDVEFAWRWASRAVVMSEGQVLADDTPAAVFAEEALLRQAGLVRPILYEVAQMLGEVPEGCRTLDALRERCTEDRIHA